MAVLVSGRGTNLQAILEAKLPVEVVVSNVPDALALKRAVGWGIPTLVQPKGLGREERDRQLVAELRRRGVGLIACAGYNQILSTVMLDAFPNRIVNVHPSLLPAFAGGMAPAPQRQALEYGVKVSGCTVHLVTADVDQGPILAQSSVAVKEDDTVESLSQRILIEEHKLLPLVLRWILEDRLEIEGRQVRLQPKRLDVPQRSVR